MSIFDPIDLTLVPPPQVIEEPAFETIYTDILTQFRTFLPEYTLLVESDPVVKVIQAWAYRELILRQRINQVAKSNLLPFAIGNDLDNLAAFYNVRRLQIAPAVLDVLGNVVVDAQMESDDRLRSRVQLRRSSTAGGVAHYKYWALTADPRVVEAAVYSPDFVTPVPINVGGQVYIVIRSTESGGIPSEDLLNVVQLAISDEEVRVLTDIVNVIPPNQHLFDVQATIKLYPNVPRTEVDNAIARLNAAFTAALGLGRDITLSWLMAQIGGDKVHSINLVQPVADVIVAPNEIPVMNSVNIVFGGYADAEGYGVVELDSEKAQREVNRLFVQYVIDNKLTRADIQSSLQEAPTPGVISPTIRGIAEYLNLLGTHDTNGNWLPDDELCFLIWRNLSPQYAS